MKVAGYFGVTFCQSSMLLVLQKQIKHPQQYMVYCEVNGYLVFCRCLLVPVGNDYFVCTFTAYWMKNTPGLFNQPDWKTLEAGKSCYSIGSLHLYLWDWDLCMCVLGSGSGMEVAVGNTLFFVVEMCLFFLCVIDKLIIKLKRIGKKILHNISHFNVQSSGLFHGKQNIMKAFYSERFYFFNMCGSWQTFDGHLFYFCVYLCINSN